MHTATKTISTTGTTDLGEDHTYRYINVNVSTGNCTLLWTNPNIAAATFAPQTVSINLTNYDGVLINITFHGNINVPSSGNTRAGSMQSSYVYLSKGISSDIIIIGGIYSNQSSSRHITSITNSGVVFGNAIFYNAGSIIQSGVDDYAIPVKIYGVKCSNLPSVL